MLHFRIIYGNIHSSLQSCLKSLQYRRHVYCESVVNEGPQTVVGGLGVVGIGCLVGVVFVFVVY